MKKILLLITIVFLLSNFMQTGYADIKDDEQTYSKLDFYEDAILSEDYCDYSVMKLDINNLRNWEEQYNNAKKAYIDPKLNNYMTNVETYSILDLLDYIPSERSQGRCGNCWAWPSTGILEIALNVQEGIFNRLSLQYINSCGFHVGIGCCEGGTLEKFTNFYRYTDMAIPWDNENAHWIDKNGRCVTECESISTTPNYPISSIYPLTIETHEVSEDIAISNIKNILHQQKGIYFSFYGDYDNYISDFQDFWADRWEYDVYNMDAHCGNDFPEDDLVGHATLVVGYNDEEGVDDDYWIVLNSWGTTNKRPNGLFLMNMHMNYDCTISADGDEFYAFNFQTLNVTFGSEEGAPNPPSIDGPISGVPGTIYTYNISTIDPQNDDISYFVDWGDNTTEGWIGLVSSGTQIVLNHSWVDQGQYTISVKAKDINDDESLWGTLSISMPRVRLFNKIPGSVIWLIEKFPFLQPYFLNI